MGKRDHASCRFKILQDRKRCATDADRRKEINGRVPSLLDRLLQLYCRTGVSFRLSSDGDPAAKIAGFTFDTAAEYAALAQQFGGEASPGEALEITPQQDSPPLELFVPLPPEFGNEQPIIQSSAATPLYLNSVALSERGRIIVGLRLRF
jgi:hypothetical protein